jgi:hypothetical protein
MFSLARTGAGEVRQDITYLLTFISPQTEYLIQVEQNFIVFA